MNRIESLRDKNPDIREATARELGEAGDKSAVPALIEALNDGNSGVRLTVAEALWKIGDKSAVPALIEALKDVNSIVRSNASKALGKIGNESALESLRYVVNNDKYKSFALPVAILQYKKDISSYKSCPYQANINPIK